MAAALTWVRSALDRASANGPSCDWSGTVVATKRCQVRPVEWPAREGRAARPWTDARGRAATGRGREDGREQDGDQPSGGRCPTEASLGAGSSPHRSQRANAADGTQPRSSDGDRLSGSGWPTGMTPTGTKSAGMPSSSFRAWMLAGTGVPANPEASPASTAASVMSITVMPMSIHQYGTGQLVSWPESSTLSDSWYRSW